MGPSSIGGDEDGQHAKGMRKYGAVARREGAGCEDRPAAGEYLRERERAPPRGEQGLQVASRASAAERRVHGHLALVDGNR